MDKSNSVPRKSFQLVELAARNGVSVGFLYKEVAAGRLRVRKAGATSIVTVDDEAEWLAAMPALECGRPSVRKPAPIMQESEGQ